MSGNFAIKGGGVGPLMANAILNFLFDFLTTSLIYTGKDFKIYIRPLLLEYTQDD